MTRWIPVLVCAGYAAAQNASVEQAWSLLRQGRRPEAITLLRGVIREKPANADAHLLLGSVLMEDGQREESIAQLMEAVRLRPRSAQAQNALGEAYNAFDDPKAARAPFEKAIAINPKFATARMNLGSVLIQTGDLSAASAQLDRAIALMADKQDGAYARYLRAKIHTERGETERAIAALKKAVELEPDFAEAWSDLGDAYKRLQDDAHALTAFERAVRIRPDDAVAQTRLANQLLAMDRGDEAVEHFEIAQRLSPSDQSVLNGLQRALRKDGQQEKADEVKKRLAELLHEKDLSDQNSMTAIRLNNEAARLEKNGDLRAAVEKYRRALELDPAHNGIRVNLAVALLKTGDWKAGLELMRDAVKREPNNAKLKAALDDALEQAPVEFGGKGKARTAKQP